MLSRFTIQPNTPSTENRTDSPQYTPAFSTPSLTALYEEYPFSEMLPQKLPDTLKFVKSYKTEYDPIVNTNNQQYVSVTFYAEKTNTSLEMHVSEYDGKMMIADPQKPETYDLSLVLPYEKPPGYVTVSAQVGLFRAEDVTEQMIKKRTLILDDGLYKACISILCGDYVVAYSILSDPYTDIESFVQMLYNMITSSNYFSAIP